METTVIVSSAGAAFIDLTDKTSTMTIQQDALSKFAAAGQADAVGSPTVLDAQASLTTDLARVRSHNGIWNVGVASDGQGHTPEVYQALRGFLGQAAVDAMDRDEMDLGPPRPLSAVIMRCLTQLI